MIINIPEDLYQELKAVASTADQSLEMLVINRLKGLVDDPLATLPTDEQAELAALRYLSDDALRTIAAEQLPTEIQQRVHELLDKNARQVITEPESQELERLVERGDQVMVRKAEALSLLQQRGDAVSQRDLKP